MKACPVCGGEVIGRSDKKFCSAKCKSAAQHEARQQNESFFLEVDRQLKVNRKLLKKYNLTGYTTLRRQVLLEEGFNPRYFTHYWKNTKGQVYFFCYDYGYMNITPSGKEKYLIIEWQEYMK